MNGKKAKALRKLVGFKPSPSRRYEYIGARRAGETHAEKFWQTWEPGADGVMQPVTKTYAVPLTARNIAGTPRAMYQETKR